MPEFRDEIRKRLAPLRLEGTREAAIVEELGQHLEDRHAELKGRGTSEQQAYDTVLAELDERDLLTKGLRRMERQPRFEPVPAGGPWHGGVAELAAQPGILYRRGFVARARYWSEYRDLPVAERSETAQPAGKESRGAGVPEALQQSRALWKFSRQLLYVHEPDLGTDSRSSASIFRDRRMELDQLQSRDRRKVAHCPRDLRKRRLL